MFDLASSCRHASSSCPHAVSSCLDPEKDRLAALSNRAACLLVLEKYEAAARDCTAALVLNLSGMDAATAAALEGGLEGHASGSNASDAPAEASATPEGVAAQAPPSVGLRPIHQAISNPEEGALNDWLAGFGLTDTSSTTEAPGSGSWPYGLAKAQQLSRVVARRGAASAHLKRFEQSVLDYESAKMLAKIGGDEPRAEQLEIDVVRLKGLRSE